MKVKNSISKKCRFFLYKLFLPNSKSYIEIFLLAPLARSSFTESRIILYHSVGPRISTHPESNADTSRDSSSVPLSDVRTPELFRVRHESDSRGPPARDAIQRRQSLSCVVRELA
ncbi:hypothetical protein EVAR_33473_1 [Eumeta japonica]|uniref:Uncharacterized protein n=1 Tax=Eumeta variegata TaxID=151549 RepID=A0A4C1WH80_EUMVA|nr:hypothetical protein EVAR_33473_1 [Eumeta japonica]